MATSLPQRTTDSVDLTLLERLAARTPEIRSDDTDRIDLLLDTPDKVKAVAKDVNVGPGALYAACAAKRCRHVRIGRSILVSRRWAIRWLRTLAAVEVTAVTD
jgi:hypothetical protein